MSNGKPFLSYQQQMDKLEKEKGLLIPNRIEAEETLKRIGYFALICGYKEPFKNPTTKKYKDGTSFEEIVALYSFDEALRELFLRYMLRIERNIRSLISYYFTSRHGEQQTEYLDSANYSKNPKHSKGIKALVSKLQNIAVSSRDYTYIEHQRTAHGNVPLWVLVNVLTFGTLSKMFEFLPQALQIDISRNFPHVSESDLQKYLSVLTKFRNVCAHNERLFSYRTRNSIADTKLHAKLNITKKGTEYTMGKCDLFSIVISFRYLLPKAEFSIFKKELSRELDRFQRNVSHISLGDLYKSMGFPPNWKLLTKYKV